MSIIFWTRTSKIQRALNKLNSNDSETRCKGAKIIDKLGLKALKEGADSQIIINTLIKGTGDSNQYVRLKCLMAIKSIEAKSSDIVSALEKCLTDSYNYARSAAAEALKQIGNDAARTFPFVQRAFAVEKDWIAKNSLEDAMEVLAEKYSVSNKKKTILSKDEINTIIQNLEAASVSNLGNRFNFEKKLIMLSKIGPPAAPSLMRLALICIPHNDYLEHEWVLRELEKAGLSDSGDVSETLDWVEKECEGWKGSSNYTHQANKAKETALSLIGKLGKNAIPVLENLLENQYKDFWGTKGEVKEVAMEVLNELKKR